MHVVATAGHVDHGKTTLVRALTAMEPDRLAEEQRRGMTLDLGFGWTTLPTGSVVSFVDVPGHERFVPTMLAGVGPVPAAMVVVAADEGWREQTIEHVAILDSLGVRHGLVVVTRSDLADPAAALAESRRRLSGTGLANAEIVAVSPVSGVGMEELRRALDRLVGELPVAERTGRVRLFVDRSFTIQGAGTVVTGTLGAGELAVGDEVELFPSGARSRIRGLQCLGSVRRRVGAVARVAVNLRGVAKDEIGRGDALLTPSAWVRTEVFDARLMSSDPAELPGDLVLHLGSAAVGCTLRPFGTDTGRIRLARPLPLRLGDRAVLRDPSRRMATGLIVLDVEPHELRRRGAARLRAEELAGWSGEPDPRREVAARGATTRRHLEAIGALGPDAQLPGGVVETAGFVIDPNAWRRWATALDDVVDEDRAARPLDPGVTVGVARRALGLPDAALVVELVEGSSGRLSIDRGRITRPGSAPAFSADVTAGIERLRLRLDANPFDAPEAHELAADGLTTKVIAAAARSQLFLRLPGEILLHLEAGERAMVALRRLSQPFTLSDARQALETTRRIAVPLLEHLDATGRTIRVDQSRRRVREP